MKEQKNDVDDIYVGKNHNNNIREEKRRGKKKNQRRSMGKRNQSYCMLF